MVFRTNVSAMKLAKGHGERAAMLMSWDAQIVTVLVSTVTAMSSSWRQNSEVTMTQSDVHGDKLWAKSV